MLSKHLTSQKPQRLDREVPTEPRRPQQLTEDVPYFLRRPSALTMKPSEITVARTAGPFKSEGDPLQERARVPVTFTSKDPLPPWDQSSMKLWPYYWPASVYWTL